MKTTFCQLFSHISLSVALAGGLLVVTAEAQSRTRVQSSPSRIETSRSNKIDLTNKHYSPTVNPWADEKINTHTVSGEAGTASGGVQLKVLETRAGTYLNNGQNGVGVGAAGQAHLIRVTAGGTAETRTIRSQGRDILGNSAAGTTEIYAGARGLAETGLDFGKDPTLKARVGGFVGQNLSAEGNARTKILGGGVGVNGTASVGMGAEGSAGLSFSKDGTKIGAGGFAGDRATVSGGFDVVGVGGNLTADGYAGVGAEISSESSFKNGKLKIKGTLGAALGVGGRVGVDLTVDLNKVEEEGKAFASSVEHFGKQAGEQIKTDFTRFGNEVDREVKQAAVVVEADLNKAANEVKAVFEQQIPSAFNNAGNEIKQTFEQKVPDAFNQFGRDADREINKAVNQVGNDFNKAGKDIESGLNNFGKSLKFW
jgi:hypothetical protein